jgi:hypothetical protein
MKRLAACYHYPPTKPNTARCSACGWRGPISATWVYGGCYAIGKCPECPDGGLVRRHRATGDRRSDAEKNKTLS